MIKTFTYTILQYKHSLLLNETINVGILFEFHEDGIVRFVEGNLARVKSIYNNFDTPTTNRVLKNIQARAVEISKENNSLFRIFNAEDLHKNLLREDDSSIQFSKPKTATYPFDNVDKIIEQYCRLFLPSGNIKVNQQRHNDNYVFRTYNNYVFHNRKELETVANRDRVVQTKDISLTFDIAWENGTYNLVKPLSFDYQDGNDIQNKSVAYFGYLTKLNDYAISHNARYDLLVSRPQNLDLRKRYEKAIEIINSADAPKRIVTEDELKDYSEETAFYLRKKLDDLKESL